MAGSGSGRAWLSACGAFSGSAGFCDEEHSPDAKRSRGEARLLGVERFAVEALLSFREAFSTDAAYSPDAAQLPSPERSVDEAHRCCALRSVALRSAGSRNVVRWLSR